MIAYKKSITRNERNKSILSKSNDQWYIWMHELNRELIKFKTDLLNKKNKNKYLTETEYLIKLLQKHIDKVERIEAKLKKIKCLSQTKLNYNNLTKH